MSDTQTIACVQLPNPPQLSISLPFGITLNAMPDYSKGPPTNLAIVQSLFVQLSPALAGMSCIFKMLNFIMVFQNLGPTNFLSTVPKIAEAALALSECFSFPTEIVVMIVDILLTIITFLLGIIEEVEGLLNAQLSINLDAAAGNPALQASLTCAQNNLATTSAQLQLSLGLIAPILGIIQPILNMAPTVPGPVGQAITAIPQAIATIGSVLSGGGSASASVSAGTSPLETLQEVQNTLTELQGILASLAG
ncbi:MAG TPA: hypothetical protein VMR33_19475 [Candidatus Baltobacteraceae bacterium]|jgi:hypothetical protein|nr:hypothetical protein [Candidatus Baltobacteraceae bacterium]